MNTHAADLTLMAFGFFNLLRLASYFPQILAVVRDRQGATAISFSCWSIWVGANGSTAAYAWVNLGDGWLAAVHFFNAACCATVLLLAILKRRDWRRRTLSGTAAHTAARRHATGGSSLALSSAASSDRHCARTTLHSSRLATLRPRPSCS